MKEITIQVPDGKSAEWVNGLLTLVDEPKVDNRPITERVKTFEDACKELSRRAEAGDETASNLLADYETNADNILDDTTKAYMRLAIITAALNEGWEPQFTEDEYRYFPWFYLYTKEEYDKMDEEKKRRCVLRSGSYTNAYSASRTSMRIAMLRTRTPSSARGLSSNQANSQDTLANSSPRNGLTFCLGPAQARSQEPSDSKL